jgi:hypothetical protein
MGIIIASWGGMLKNNKKNPKLVVSRETLRTLSKKALRDVAGGDITDAYEVCVSFMCLSGTCAGKSDSCRYCE